MEGTELGGEGEDWAHAGELDLAVAFTIRFYAPLQAGQPDTGLLESFSSAEEISLTVTDLVGHSGSYFATTAPVGAGQL